MAHAGELVVPGIELCILKSFPPGYKLYTHHKITAEEHRKDHYLLGGFPHCYDHLPLT
jgi:hypothetical protein